VAERRLTADDHPQVPWPAFPSVAQGIADWLKQQATTRPGHVILTREEEIISGFTA